jgi:hypothetical protein
MKRMWRWAILLPVATFLAGNMCVWPAPRFLGFVALGLVSLIVWTFVAFLAAVPASVYFTVTGFIHRRRDGETYRRISQAVACWFFIVLWLLAMIAVHSFRHRAFVRASQVGDRIVQSLAQYRDDNGDFPDQLDQLCPDYLAEIPYTGMISYPNFTYDKLKLGDYELRIDCSWGFNFDTFIYQPSESYPQSPGGNRVERIGKWAYLHD